jgi:hypothetical protein
MDHNIDLNYRRKIRPLISFCFLLAKDNQKVKKVKKFFEKGKNKMQFSSLSESEKEGKIRCIF